MPYFVLSLDGGGIRGVLTARVLERIEERTGFLRRVDLVAGTSTGGILAIGLARGLTPKQLVALYAENGRRIFSARDLLDAIPGDELWRADYSTEALREVLNPHFDGLTLGQLGKRVLIPSFDLDNDANPRMWKPKFFHNYDSPGNDREVSALDAALRTSAAPTYFPSYQGYIDGGVVANNPSTCALARAIKAGQKLEDIELLALGTGVSPGFIHGDHDWGRTQWLAPLLKILFEGMPGVADYQCEQLLGERYRRLDALLPHAIDLDAVTRIPQLLTLADELDIDPIVRWLTVQNPQRG